MLKRLLVVLAVPLALAAQETKSPAASKSDIQADVKVGTSVEKRNIVGASDQFTVAANTKLYAWAKVTGLPAGSKATLAFFRGDKKVFGQEMSVGGSPWRLHAYKTFRAGDSGDWTAKLLGPDGAEIATAVFKVEIQK